MDPVPEPDMHPEQDINPDPHWDFLFDPDPQKMNVDPQHWFKVNSIYIQTGRYRKEPTGTS